MLSQASQKCKVLRLDIIGLYLLKTLKNNELLDPGCLTFPLAFYFPNFTLIWHMVAQKLYR